MVGINFCYLRLRYNSKPQLIVTLARRVTGHGQPFCQFYSGYIIINQFRHVLSSTRLAPIIIILPLIRCIHYHIRPKVTSWSNPAPQPTPSPINQSWNPRVICCSNLLLRNTFGGSGDHPVCLGTGNNISARHRLDVTCWFSQNFH